jgi:hypothetical protein
MPRVGLDPTIPVFERTKPVNALDFAVTVVRQRIVYMNKIANFAESYFYIKFKSKKLKNRNGL